MEAVLRLLGLEMPQDAADQIVHIIRVRDAGRLPYAIELLENHLDRRSHDLLLPLLTKAPPPECDAVATAFYRDLPSDLAPKLAEWLYSPRTWVAAIAADSLRRAGKTDIIEAIDWARVSGTHFIRKALLPENTDGVMYSTLDKTILLKSVGLFSEIPGEKLSRIAQVAEETHWPAGTRILRQGDAGDSLFVVADGTVRVHTGETHLAHLRRGECLGEMAVLDGAPRSADATAEEETTLLRISQEDFYEVLAANPEITERIVRMLTRRLREANAKLAARSAAGG